MVDLVQLDSLPAFEYRYYNTAGTKEGIFFGEGLLYAISLGKDNTNVGSLVVYDNPDFPSGDIRLIVQTDSVEDNFVIFNMNLTKGLTLILSGASTDWDVTALFLPKIV